MAIIMIDGYVIYKTKASEIDIKRLENAGFRIIIKK